VAGGQAIMLLQQKVFLNIRDAEKAIEYSALGKR
jgi:hypothetical protein